MSIVNTLSLESNRQIKINFDGGDLSSDAGLLLIKEFVSKLDIDKVFIILMKGSFVCIINGFEHLNFTTNGCSFFIHLISEKQYSIKI